MSSGHDAGRLPPLQYHLLYCMLRLTDYSDSGLKIRLNLLAEIIGDIIGLGQTNKTVTRHKAEFEGSITDIKSDLRYLRSCYQPYFEYSFDYEYSTYGDFEAAYDEILTAMKIIIQQYQILGNIRPECMDLLGPAYAKLNRAAEVV